MMETVNPRWLSELLDFVREHQPLLDDEHPAISGMSELERVIWHLEDIQLSLPTDLSILSHALRLFRKTGRLDGAELRRAAFKLLLDALLLMLAAGVDSVHIAEDLEKWSKSPDGWAGVYRTLQGQRRLPYDE